MIPDSKKIEDSALKLDEKQRALLARQLLISLENIVDEDVEQAWVEEINRRKAQHTSGDVDMIDADQVLQKARNLLKK